MCFVFLLGFGLVRPIKIGNHFGFQRCSEFVSSSPALLSFDFAIDSKYLKASLFAMRFETVTHCSLPKLSLFVNPITMANQLASATQFGLLKLLLFASLSDYQIRLEVLKYFAFGFPKPLLFVKLSMLVNWSDCLICLDPAKYFAFGFPKTSLFVKLSMLVNWSDCLIHLKPGKYFAFVNDSEFVSSSAAPLSFDFAMEWTFPKQSLFVSLSDYQIRLKLVKYFAFVNDSGFVSASLNQLSFDFVME